MAPMKACIVGSGNWGSAIARIMGVTVKEHSSVYNPTVNMWVFEEMVEGKKLSEIINTKHENVKYLPGKALPTNVVAIPDIVESVKDCDILVFVVPHQFIEGICKQLHGKIKPSAIGISLIKGIAIAEDGSLKLISDEIKEALNIPMAVLMGANLAHEVAGDNFCEATIGCKDKELGVKLKKLFNSPNFRINVAEDAHTVELCGALKNIVACGAGFTDGLGYGDNTKAAVIRLGLMEMTKFIEHFYPGSNLATFFESCGIADLITTCYGGRNRKVAEAFVKTGKRNYEQNERAEPSKRVSPEFYHLGEHEDYPICFAFCKLDIFKSMKDLEIELLGGQRLQGPHTAEVVYKMLCKYKMQDKYPLFTAIHRICIGQLKPAQMVDMLREHPPKIDIP